MTRGLVLFSLLFVCSIISIYKMLNFACEPNFVNTVTNLHYYVFKLSNPFDKYIKFEVMFFWTYLGHEPTKDGYENTIQDKLVSTMTTRTFMAITTPNVSPHAIDRSHQLLEPKDSRTVAGHVSSTPGQIVFNPKEDWNETLDNMRVEFDSRWNSVSPSLMNNLENYNQRSILGTGSFGTVYLVREKTGKNYYAAKQMNKDDLVRMKQVTHVHNEKFVLSAVRFPFLVHLIDSSKDFDNLYLVLPFVNGGELFTYHRKVRKFNEKQARFYATQVLLALEYMHHMKIVYRDLKPENILIDNKGYIKITDFGFAKRVETRTSTLCGTPEYLAPEIIQMKPYNKTVDFWAFGILVYEFVAGRSPFSAHHRDAMVMYNKICCAEYRIPTYFTGQLKNLVDGLLTIEITKRLGISGNGIQDVKEHDWFHGIDWFAVLNQEINPPYIPTVSNIDDVSNFEHFEPKSKSKSKSNRHPDLFDKF